MTLVILLPIAVVVLGVVELRVVVLGGVVVVVPSVVMMVSSGQVDPWRHC